MKIVEIREKTIPISSPIRNAYIDFSKMTLSLVAVITDVIRDGKPVVGYGFNSNGRYGQGKLMRERFIPRVMEAEPESLFDADGRNLDPHKVWNTMFTNEKPGGHGERSVAIGTIDMAVWDAVAKIEEKPLFQLLADRYGDGKLNHRPRRLAALLVVTVEHRGIGEPLHQQAEFPGDVVRIAQTRVPATRNG